MTEGSEFDPDEVFPDYDEIPTFDPDEFVVAFTWAMNAASGEATVEDPTSVHFGLVDDEGLEQVWSFTDTPMARLTMAMKERYGDDTRKYVGASMRIYALIQLLRKGVLNEWIRSDPDDPENREVNDVVVEAAAVVGLDKDWVFPEREFIDKVREIEASASE